MDSRELLLEIFTEALDAVRPDRLIRDALRLEAEHLVVAGRRYPLPKGRAIHLFGSGKASLPAARAVEDVLGERLAGGVIVTNRDDGTLTRVEVMVGAHPVPDERSIAAAKRMAQALAALDEEDFFLYLLSGGSSALMEWPLTPLTLDDLQATAKLLLEGGLTIEEMNRVRTHLSQVKGGRLGHATKARGLVLVISDVIGDDLHTIGSAPLYRDPSDFREVRTILTRHGLWERVPERVARLLAEGLAGTREETPKVPNPRLDHLLLGSNTLALNRAKARAEELGLPAQIMTSRLRGEAREVAKVLVALAEEIRTSYRPFVPPVCLLFGGETTVTVQGKGRGGRNQEMCVAALQEIGERPGLLFFSAGSDGIDGNTEAAGALVDHESFHRARELGLKLDDSIATSDTHSLLAQTHDLIVTGPTGTNVMDITMLLITGET